MIVTKYEWTAALRRKDGSLRPVGVAHAEDVEPDARDHVLDHYSAWKRDAAEVGRPEEVVLVRRVIGEWEVVEP